MVHSSLLATLVLSCTSPSWASVLPHARDTNAQHAANAHLFAHPDLAIPDAPAENVLTIGSHPNPDIFHSPARARFQARQALVQKTKKRRWWHLLSRDDPTVHTEESGSAMSNTATGTVFSGVYPVVNVTWGNKATPGEPEPNTSQTFVSYIDTGSADTFAVSNKFVCRGLPDLAANTLSDDTVLPGGGNTHLAQSACNFGPLYDMDKGNFTNITSQEFRIAYMPENDALNGSMVFAPITIGGLTVPHQQVAIVEDAVWMGDGVSSGMLGLAYPAVTSAMVRSTSQRSGLLEPQFIDYDPFFTSLAKQQKSKQGEKASAMSPVFTLAIDRVPHGTPHWESAGAFALGGLVPSKYYTGNFTSVPIEKPEPQVAGGNSAFSFYTTTAQIVYGPPGTNISSAISADVSVKSANLTASPAFQTIVDTGTSPNFVPEVAAIPINSLFDPPARFNKTLNYFVVDCDAKVPFVAYRIGGKTSASGVTTGGVLMPLDPRDMIVRSLNGLPGYDDVCFSSIANGGEIAGNLQIIGATWQRNYVVAYDQGRNMMHFANRRPY